MILPQWCLLRTLSCLSRSFSRGFCPLTLTPTIWWQKLPSASHRTAPHHTTPHHTTPPTPHHTTPQLPTTHNIPISPGIARWRDWWSFSMDTTVMWSSCSKFLKFGMKITSSPTFTRPVRMQPITMVSLPCWCFLKCLMMVMRRGAAMLRVGSGWAVNTSQRVGPWYHWLIGNWLSPFTSGKRLSPI